MFRAFLLKEQLRLLYALEDPALAPAHLDAGLSNGRLEGLNSRIRLISHRSFGFHSAAPLIPRLPLLLGNRHRAPPMTLHHQTVRSAQEHPSRQEAPSCGRSAGFADVRGRAPLVPTPNPGFAIRPHVTGVMS